MWAPLRSRRRCGRRCRLRGRMRFIASMVRRRTAMRPRRPRSTCLASEGRGRSPRSKATWTSSSAGWTARQRALASKISAPRAPLRVGCDMCKPSRRMSRGRAHQQFASWRRSWTPRPTLQPSMAARAALRRTAAFACRVWSRAASRGSRRCRCAPWTAPPLCARPVFFAKAGPSLRWLATAAHFARRAPLPPGCVQNATSARSPACRSHAHVASGACSVGSFLFCARVVTSALMA
mmetsp:Transcript_97085/g.279409  ORF Transcript_97085/g.279409 Transcript_97085/m.279409 type:complete len:236 (+) Transcript_97085:289-996(+)